MTTPDGKTVTKGYDPMGLVLAVTDEEDRTTNYGYDAASQLLTVTDAMSQITRYSYDPAGNKLTQTDANSHTTNYTWDNLNRRMSRTLPAGQSESFGYDFEGNMLTRTDFNGKTTSFAYDSLSRLLSRTPDASFVGAVAESFTYTGTGQRLTMTDASGTTNYTYSNRDQVLTKATPEGTLAYTYDLSGNVSSVVSSNAGGTNTAYAWDQDNRLQSVTDNRNGGVTSYSYDATSQLASFGYPNSVAHSYSYDSRDRVTGLSVTNGSSVIASYTQTFSFSGRKLSAAEASGRTPSYGYDAIYRLLSENITGDPTSANNGSLNYTLDPVGNRQSLTSTLAALPPESLSYDADDRLTSDTYDANGNTLSSGGVNYAYDFEDRLVSASSGVQIVYDGDRNRVSETAGGVTTSYLVDELTPTHYAQVAEELVNGSVAAQFTYGPMRISQNRSGTLSYYGYDAGGSVRENLSTSGAVTDTYAYDAFGNTVARVGSTVNEFQYRGEQLDSATAQYYLRARYYAPRTGRFLTSDREFERVTEPLTLHKYIFGSADPVNRIDPSGQANIITRALVFAGIVEAIAPKVYEQIPEEEEALIALENYCVPRASQLYSMFNPIAQNMRTVGAGFIRAADGTRRLVIAVSSNQVTAQIRIEIQLLDQELQEEVSGFREKLLDDVGQYEHAEDAIQQYANAIGGRLLSIAYSGPRAMCGSCQNVLDPATKRVWIGE